MTVQVLISCVWESKQDVSKLSSFDKVADNLPWLSIPIEQCYVTETLSISVLYRMDQLSDVYVTRFIGCNLAVKLT